jgi:rhomboid protease GluP
LFFELLLLSVVVMTAYLGPMILRRYGPHQRVFGLMLLATLALALIAFVSRTVKGASAEADTIGAIAIGAAFCLVMLPPTIRDLGRRALAGNHLRIAKLLSDLRELLQPGMGGRQESELVGTILAVREGREGEIVAALEARRERVQDSRAVRSIDERIVMTLLYAQQWDEAVERYERLTGGGHRPGSPHLTVEMMRAYCESNQLGKAAELMQIIEDSPVAKEPLLVTLVSRARLVFLAFVGRTNAVESIVGPSGPLAQMPEAARRFWFGIARLNAGDASGARTSLREAARLSEDDPRAQRVAEDHLARVDVPGQMGPHSVSMEVAELADRLTSIAGERSSSSAAGSTAGKPTSALPRLSAVPLRIMPVTAVMAAANIVGSLLVYLVFGNITDLGSLIATGANLKSATLGGEWWRLGSSIFLHVGVAHLALNVYGLWILGRLVEQMQGSIRTVAIYLLSGFVGALASTYLGGGATAVGASGAVLGLMGAAVAELAIYREDYPRRWARSLLGMLVVLSLAQVSIGFFYPIVDQWGHVGGLVCGAFLGMVLSPKARRASANRRRLGGVLAAGALLFLVYTLFSVSTTNYTDTLRGYERVTRNVGGLQVDVPSSWGPISPRELLDPGIGALLDLRRVPASEGLDATIAARLEAERSRGALRAGFDRAKASARSQLKLPSPWRGGELEVSVDDSSGIQQYRLVVFGRVMGDEIWLGAYYHPSALTALIEPVFGEVLATATAVGPITQAPR